MINYFFSTTINSNNEITGVTLEYIKSDTDVIVSNVALIKNGNIWSKSISISEEYTNKNLEYSILVHEKSPSAEMFENMPLELYLHNEYRIVGNIKFSITLRRDYLFCKRMFVTLTGRYDLVADPLNDDYSDITNVLHIIFNSAQKYLDSLFDVSKMKGYFYYLLPANESFIVINNIRYVKSVFNIKENLKEELLFYPITSGFVPEQLNEKINVDVREILGFPDDMYNNHYPTKVIYVEPYEEDRNILIETFYFSKELINDNDITFWTSEYPELLVRTALMFFERYNRNYTDSTQLERSIVSEVMNISKDYVSEYVNSIPYYRMKME